MLKIKDNVDLKELEKFGFEYDNDIDAYVMELYSKKVKGVFIPFVNLSTVYVDSDRNVIAFDISTIRSMFDEHLELFGDLLEKLSQAGLVEK